jgi:hypothetical protein
MLPIDVPAAQRTWRTQAVIAATFVVLVILAARSACTRSTCFADLRLEPLILRLRVG